MEQEEALEEVREVVSVGHEMVPVEALEEVLEVV